jgi:multimeric flavodoxin WrbA
LGLINKLQAEGYPGVNQINTFFINNMIVPGSTYWNLAAGYHPGDVLKDEEGMQALSHLGKNMAWLLKIIR